MFIATCTCDWKCCKELNMDICLCQNSPIATQKTHNFSDTRIVNRYLKNKLTSAVVIAGLEPLLQWEQLLALIQEFRSKTDDDIVIYTGYYPEEIKDKIVQLKKFKNIIVKFGRYIPGQEVHLDPVLGVNLANKQQYAVNLENYQV